VVCCSMLVCCGMLQCGVVCRSVGVDADVGQTELTPGVLQCVALCCSVFQVCCRVGVGCRC